MKHELAEGSGHRRVGTLPKYAAEQKAQGYSRSRASCRNKKSGVVTRTYSVCATTPLTIVREGVFGFTTSFTLNHPNPPTDVPRHRSRHVSRHRSPMCHDIVHPTARPDRSADVIHVEARGGAEMRLSGRPRVAAAPVYSSLSGSRIAPGTPGTASLQVRCPAALAAPKKRNDVLTHPPKKRNDDATHHHPRA